jgi:hypothetical protein
VALFRYDAGFFTSAAELLVVGACVVSQGRSRLGPLAGSLRVVLLFGAGCATAFLPWAAYFLAVAPIGDFVFDIVTVPARDYVRMRSLPFPRPDTLDADTILVYLPIAVWAVTGFALLRPPGPSRKPEAVERRWGLLLLLLVSVILYAKGIVRVSPLHLTMSIVPALLLLAVLAPPVRRSMLAAGTYLCLALAGVSALGDLWRVETRRVIPNLVWLGRGEAWQAPKEGEAWRSGSCRTPAGLERLACFTTDQKRVDAVRFVQAHTTPEEAIFSGTGRHDKIFVNDVLFYFLAARPAATKWHHFDPGLQTSAPIQQEIVGEFRARPPRLIILEPEWDEIREPNESARSSGVFVLDEALRAQYRPVARFGDISVEARAVP